MRADPSARRASSGALVLATILSLLVVAPVHAQTPAAVETAVRVATGAVRDAFGGDVDVTISNPVLQLVPGAGDVVRAVPEPSSRTAGRVRFVLHGSSGRGSTRVGRLTADVRVRALHVRTRGPVAPRATLTTDMIDVVRDDVGRHPFCRLPTFEEVIGAAARRPLGSGDVVTSSALVSRPLVVSGDEVVTVARLGGLEVRGRAIAAQSGGLGDAVIVVNPDSRKRLHGRVAAGALVEIRHGS